MRRLFGKGSKEKGDMIVMMKKIICCTLLFVVLFTAKSFASDDKYWSFINLCKNGTVEEFNRIMGKVGVNTPLNFEDSTPIIAAAESNMFGIVRRLVDMGADINYLNNKNRNALYYAMQCNNLKMAQYLLDHGADIKMCDKNHVQHPILIKYLSRCRIFTSSESKESLMFMLKNGASYLDSTPRKDTFVHTVIVDHFNFDDIQFFYKVNPDEFIKCLTIRNSKGRTPIDIAKNDGMYGSHDEIVAFMNGLLGREMLNPYE